MNNLNERKKNIKLSKRLETILRLIPDTCNYLVDVGCDHGHLSDAFLRLAAENKALLIDLREQPLERAKHNLLVKSKHSPEKLVFSLSSGLNAWDPNSKNFYKQNNFSETDVNDTCIVIAGLGAKEIINIFADKLDQLSATDMDSNVDVYMIIQAMRNQENIRLFMRENGFPLLNQSIVEDKDFVYSVDLYKVNLSKVTSYPELKSTNNIVDFLGLEFLKTLKEDTQTENNKYIMQKYLERQIRIAVKEAKSLPEQLFEERMNMIKDMRNYLKISLEEH